MVLLFRTVSRPPSPTPPSVSNVAIAPVPTVGSAVGCNATVIDPDDQPLTTVYSWTNDSTNQSLGTSASIILMGAQVSEGDVIRCELTVTDPYGEVAVGSASETVVNSPPQILQLQVTPSLPSDQTLCSAFVIDPEGDSISTSIEWEDAVGQTVGSGDELALPSLGAQVGDDFTCVYTATDGGGQGATQSVTVTVIDGPVITELLLSPASPTTDSIVTANVVVSDPEGQSVSLTYDWFVDGVPMTETSPQILGCSFNKIRSCR